MKEELRNTGRELLVSAAGVPALAAGYLLLTIALGFLLAVWIPQWAAFGIVALANLGAGAILTLFWGRRALRQRLSLPRTGEELRRDKEWLAALKKGQRALPWRGEMRMSQEAPLEEDRTHAGTGCE